MSTRRGWIRVDAQTSVCLHQGQPVRLRARLRSMSFTPWVSLEGVAERASQWVGAPINVGSWTRVDGQTWEAECGLVRPEAGNTEWN